MLLTINKAVKDQLGLVPRCFVQFHIDSKGIVSISKADAGYRVSGSNQINIPKHIMIRFNPSPYETLKVLEVEEGRGIIVAVNKGSGDITKSAAPYTPSIQIDEVTSAVEQVLSPRSIVNLRGVYGENDLIELLGELVQYIRKGTNIKYQVRLSVYEKNDKLPALKISNRKKLEADRLNLYTARLEQITGEQLEITHSSKGDILAAGEEIRRLHPDKKVIYIQPL